MSAAKKRTLRSVADLEPAGVNLEDPAAAAAAQAFIANSKATQIIEQTKGKGADSAPSPSPVQAPVAAPSAPVVPTPGPGLFETANARVKRQLNIPMPETEYLEMQVVVAHIPQMSMARFVREAIKEKIDRVRHPPA